MESLIDLKQPRRISAREIRPGGTVSGSRQTRARGRIYADGRIFGTWGCLLDAEDKTRTNPHINLHLS